MTATTQATIRYYDLLPEQNWEVDLESLEAQIDENTAFFLINKCANPPCCFPAARTDDALAALPTLADPTGPRRIFAKLLLSLRVARSSCSPTKVRSPLPPRQTLAHVSLAVYAGLAWNVTGPRPASADVRIPGKFNRGVFTPYASVAGGAPVLVLGAVSKRWLAPGWRLGWVIVHDPLNVLTEVRDGLNRWAFRIQVSQHSCALGGREAHLR